MKIAFGMIVFEGDYVLKECLEQVYPFASQILIAEGPVKYWQEKGFSTSTDLTNKIIDDFPDPDRKIKVIHGQFEEKDDQCKAYMQFINDDIDYIWNLDSDEVYKTKDLHNIIQFLKDEKPTSLGVRSCSFYGGFDRYLTGFELNTDNFLRIFKHTKGATWLTHRPPTIKYPNNYGFQKRHINSDQLYEAIGFQMYHYSYVFPNQVYKKLKYYKESLNKSNCIENYFENVYLPWVIGNKKEVENKYRGVHEFISRPDCYTAEFKDSHPESISKNMDILKFKFENQLQKYLSKYDE